MVVKKIEDVAAKCQHFYSAYKKYGIMCNSGYNCNHPDQSETYSERGIEVGMCYCFSCPLGRMATSEDFESKDIDNNGYFYEEGRYLVVDL